MLIAVAGRERERERERTSERERASPVDGFLTGLKHCIPRFCPLFCLVEKPIPLPHFEGNEHSALESCLQDRFEEETWVRCWAVGLVPDTHF